MEDTHSSMHRAYPDAEGHVQSRMLAQLREADARCQELPAIRLEGAAALRQLLPVVSSLFRTKPDIHS